MKPPALLAMTHIFSVTTRIFADNQLSMRMRASVGRQSVIGIAVLSALLTACSHTPSAGDIPPGANFTANILDNGTKLFTFSTRSPHQSRDMDNTVRRGDGQQGEERPRAHIDQAPANKKALQAMLQENGYCREGFVLLEMYEDRTNYVMRGECRDGADDNDRAKYAHH